MVNVIFSLNLKQKQLDDNSVSEMSKLLKMLNSVQSIKICLENNKLNELGFISIFCALKTFNKLIHL